ncbi:MAG: peptidoglycan DD-metalloendopeptidase family protein [Deltaproteobacteria bacterium]|nr:peptidoglycan DD-metalloendopeptidase family protein [Deltaproteobacteria bacterium]
MRPSQWFWVGSAILAATGLAGIHGARALTPPMGGAVGLPPGVALVLPFPAGSNVRVLSAYSPSGGSSLHDGTTRTCCANDYYALDLDYADEADGGLGLPILAPLRGTVEVAGWATEGWANYGQRVILRHDDLGDGRVYFTIYCHLNAIDPAITEGAVVEAGQAIGELGRSCQGALSCSSFSAPHLHWALHQDSMIGGSGTGGSYAGRAVVPEPMDGAEDLSRGDVITSTNSGGGPVPTCEPVPAEGRIVDERDRCFRRFGTAAYWHSESAAGWDDSLVWTEATSDASPDNHGIWSLAFDEGGDYLVEAFTAAGFAQSRRARYRVTHAGSEDSRVVDQSSTDGWNVIGTFRFATGGDQSVRLDDNTGEPIGDHVRIAFDAIRLTRDGTAPPPPPADGGSPPPPPPRDAGAAMDASSPPPPSSPDASRSDADFGRDGSSGGTTDSGGRGEAGASVTGASGVQGGCGCVAAGARDGRDPRGGEPVLGAAVLGLVAFARARRRTRARAGR